MSFQPDQLKHLTRLARLSFSDSDAGILSTELGRVLGLVEQLQTVSVANIQPMAHPVNLGLNLREDVATEPDQSATLLALAPDSQAGLYLVPKVIE